MALSALLRSSKDDEPANHDHVSLGILASKERLERFVYP